MFKEIANRFAKRVDELVTSNINQNQFKLIHYKWIGKKYTTERRNMLKNRGISDFNAKRNFTAEYVFDEESFPSCIEYAKIDNVYRSCGQKETVMFCDRIMSLGFKYACYAGISIGKDDMIIPKQKQLHIAESFDKQITLLGSMCGNKKIILSKKTIEIL